MKIIDTVKVTIPDDLDHSSIDTYINKYLFPKLSSKIISYLQQFSGQVSFTFNYNNTNLITQTDGGLPIILENGLVLVKVDMEIYT